VQKATTSLCTSSVIPFHKYCWFNRWIPRFWRLWYCQRTCHNYVVNFRTIHSRWRC